MKRVSFVMLAAAAALILSTTVSAQQAPANTWAIDAAHSSAGFAVKHLMVSTVRGTLGPVTGSIVWDGKNTSSIKADVSIDVKKINTGIEQRDNHLRSDDFFNAEKFPTITFKSKRVIAGAGGAFKLVGDLTIRDVTKEVTLDCEAPAPAVNAMGAMRTATSATTTINRFDYNLKWNNMIETGGAVVGADVKVTIDLEVTKK